VNGEPEADMVGSRPQAVGGLAEAAAEFGLALSDEQLARFASYMHLLLDWNRRLNLTAITDPREVQALHFLDSLSCAIVTGDLNGRRLVDVGSGAGFPGLPLKILYPELQLTMIESVAKKASFLEAVVAELKLAGVAILVGRAEEAGRMAAQRGQYDWAVARAVASLAVLAEYLLPLCRTGGRMLAMKGKKAVEESASAGRAIEVMGGGEAVLRPLQLPGRMESRFLVVVEKVSATPEQYPRRAGVPAKRPLGG
jgi:16S rRNA (guanine527-N7)-methyltransferase